LRTCAGFPAPNLSATTSILVPHHPVQNRPVTRKNSVTNENRIPVIAWTSRQNVRRPTSSNRGLRTPFSVSRLPLGHQRYTPVATSRIDQEATISMRRSPHFSLPSQDAVMSDPWSLRAMFVGSLPLSRCPMTEPVYGFTNTESVFQSVVVRSNFVERLALAGGSTAEIDASG
jgi:hypothetical protein